MQSVKTPLFGPGGNSDAFFESGLRSSVFAPEWVKRYGLDCYEYQCGNGVKGSDKTLGQIGEMAREHGIALSLHAPYYISLASVDEAKRAGSIGYILQSLRAARQMGATLIVIHPGSAAKLERRDAFRLASETIAAAVQACREDGLGQIRLGLETLGKVNQLGTLDEILSLCKIDECLAPVVDFGHLYARSHGREADSADAIARVFDRISHELGAPYAERLHCHFSKILYSQGGEVKHLTFSDRESGPNPVHFARAIKKLGVAPTVICESAGTMDQDALILKELYLYE